VNLRTFCGVRAVALTAALVALAGLIALSTGGPTAAGQSAASSTATASAAGSPAASPVATTVNDDNNPDILELALLTIGAAGGAMLLALAGYVFRQRIGFWLHRPPPGGGDAEHH
jgi:hypothetical protein